MKIIALDPGGTTGVATLDIRSDDGLLPVYNWSRFKLGPEPHHSELYDILATWGWDVIIYERFQYQRRELTKGVTLSLVSVEYIGVTKLAYNFAAEYHDNPVTFVEQTPAQAKNFWTDDKLKKVGLYTTSSAHERDATRHLLYWLMMNGDQTYVNMLKP